MVVGTVFVSVALKTIRVNASGELIPLGEQDRSLWDREAIQEGIALITDTLSKGSVGPYQLQAAIAAVHDEAPGVEETDWPQIVALYGLLDRMSDNPMVKLNRAIAVAMVEGPPAGLKLLDELEKNGFIALYINFDTGKSDLKADGRATVAEIVKMLKAAPELKLAIEGHTDNVGQPAANKALSQARARSVMAAVVSGGVDAKRLSAAGFGQERPIADNRGEEGRAKNRRVELVKK